MDINTRKADEEQLENMEDCWKYELDVFKRMGKPDIHPSCPQHCELYFYLGAYRYIKLLEKLESKYPEFSEDYETGRKRLEDEISQFLASK